MQYRRTPLSSGYSPSELLNGRQLRAAIDTLTTLPAHQAQQRQSHLRCHQRLRGITNLQLLLRSIFWSKKR